MPYIKQEQRFPIIEKATHDYFRGTLSAVKWAEILGNELADRKISFEKCDGIINYALTRLLLKLPTKKPELKSPVDMIFYRTYIQFFEEHEYSGRERFLGLLYCMREEFKRREWYIHPTWFCSHIWFLAQQLDRYTKLLAIYEQSKLEENGDVT